MRTVILLLLLMGNTADAKNCKRGQPCGNTCISWSKTCHVGRSSYSPPTAPPKVTYTPPPASPSRPDGSCLYMIQPGDRLAAIAKMVDRSVDDLVRWNRISNPDRIEVGATLVVREQCAPNDTLISVVPVEAPTSSSTVAKAVPPSGKTGSGPSDAVCFASMVGFLGLAVGGPVVAFVLADAAGAAAMRRAQDESARRIAEEQRVRAEQLRERREKLDAELSLLNASWAKDREAVLAEVSGNPARYEGHYRPKKGERVLWVVPAVDDGVRVDKPGALVITNKRLHFDAQGAEKDWSRTWKGIANWRAEHDAIRIELTSGNPKRFVVDPWRAKHNPAFLVQVVEYAHYGADGGDDD
jgi:LysM repeat protein